MIKSFNSTRRQLLGKLAVTLVAGPVLLQQSYAADAALISEDDPIAKALHYVADASHAKEAKPGSTCANCSLYAGDSKSAQGSCAALNNKQVKVAGWCSAWTNM